MPKMQQELRYRGLAVSGLQADLARRLDENDRRMLRDYPVMLHELFPANGAAAIPIQAPTEAQITYVRILAARRALAIPDGTLLDRAKCSAFIDAYKQ